MRWLLSSLVLVCGLLFAQDNNPDSARKERAAKQRIAKQTPIVVNVLPVSKTPEETRREDAERKEKAELDRKLVELTGDLANYTDSLATFTKVIASLALLQLIVFGYQGLQLRRTVDVAVLESKPVLFPHISDMSMLHPLQKSSTPKHDSPIVHPANIFIAFDNYGKTPGIIRQVRAKLYLTNRDELPDVDTEKLPHYSYPVMVPGESRGKDLVTGVLDLKQPVSLTGIELHELQSEAEPSGKYRRFALIGQVTYDDFFGSRHISRFCVKMRMWQHPSTGSAIRSFQIAQGGSKYNRVKSQQIPNPDPLEQSAA